LDQHESSEQRSGSIGKENMNSQSTRYPSAVRLAGASAVGS
jgi:hypothetical protein